MKKITTRIIMWALGEQLKTILYYVFILIHLYHIICVGGGDPEICEMWPNPIVQSQTHYLLSQNPLWWVGAGWQNMLM